MNTQSERTDGGNTEPAEQQPTAPYAAPYAPAERPTDTPPPTDAPPPTQLRGRRRRTRWIVAAVAALVLLGGVGAVIVGLAGGGEKKAATPASTAPVRVADVYELAAAVTAAGYPCSGLEIVTNPTGGALQRAHCTSVVTLATFPDEATARRSAQQVNDLQGDTAPSTHIVGPNWTVNCGTAGLALCTSINKGLHGSLLTGGAQAVATAAPAAAYATPAPKDIVLTVKILKKSCYGSAGCNVTFTVEITYNGTSPVEPNKTWDVTYEVRGGDDPKTNTFEMTFDETGLHGNAQVDREEFISTPSSRSKLTAVVIAVSEH